MENEKVANFLKKISQIESSGGKDVDHPVVEEGIHAGQRAIGQYGLMPNTIDELVNRARSSKNSNEQLNSLLQMNPEQKRQFLEQNPQVETDLAQRLASQVLNQQEGNEEKAAYSWLYGHNLKPEAIESRKYQDDPYVQKFKSMSDRVPSSDNQENFTNPEYINKFMNKMFDPKEKPMPLGPLSDNEVNPEQERQAKADALVEILRKSREENPYMKEFMEGGGSAGMGRVAAIAQEAAPAVQSTAKAAFPQLQKMFQAGGVSFPAKSSAEALKIQEALEKTGKIGANRSLLDLGIK